MKALVSCLCLWVILSPVASQPSASIANEYVVEAVAAGEAGDDELVVQLLTTALEYDRSSSDALSLLGQEFARDQTTTSDGVELLTRAVALGRFRLVSPNETVVALATTLYETGHFTEAMALLEDLRVDPEDSRGLAADYAYALIATYSALEDRSAAERELVRARDLFPNDPRLVRLAIELDPFPSIEHARELDRLAQAVQEGGDTYGPAPNLLALQWALLRYAERVSTEAERERAVRRYIDLGGEDPRVLALLAQFDLDTAVTLFGQWQGWRSLDLLRSPRISALLAAESVSRSLDQASGEVVKTGVDGRWRERLIVEEGQIVSWDTDRDGDGVQELHVQFSGESPDAVVVRSGEGVVELEYGLYPFVESAEVALHSGTEAFVLRPRAVEVRVLSTLPLQGLTLSSLPVLTDAVPPSLATLRQSAVRVDLVDSNGAVVERRYHAAGDREHLARDRNGDGMWDTVEVSQGGLPRQRATDLDFDGYYEVLEGFRGGQLLARAIDENEDGVPELFEREIGVSIREWDVNEDGRIDVREFEGWRDSVVRDFPLLDQEL